jgi:beta-phosphoglucomutase-like phosphatase (HAD superfamily)
MTDRPALLLDLDGTLTDSVYQHAIAWRKALEIGGIQLSVWRIHRRIGMSGGLLAESLARETAASSRRPRRRRSSRRTRDCSRRSSRTYACSRARRT